MQLAANELKINLGCMCACCRGKRKTAGGFIWKYANNEEQEKTA